MHSIKQPNDTTLWVSTVGEGIVKVIFDASTATPTVKSASRTVIDYRKKEYTLKKGDKIIVRLARNGGFASVIE